MDSEAQIGSTLGEATLMGGGDAVDLPRYLTFLVQGQEYAVPLDRLREIVGYSSVTPVPCTPMWLLGVTNLRGDVLPVIDLAVRLGGETTAITARSCYVVLDVSLREEPMSVGLLMDAVGRITDKQGVGTLTYDAEFQSPFIRDAICLEDSTVFLLNIEALFSDEELTAAGLIRPREGGMGALTGPLPTDDELADGGIHLFDD